MMSREINGNVFIYLGFTSVDRILKVIETLSNRVRVGDLSIIYESDVFDTPANEVSRELAS